MHDSDSQDEQEDEQDDGRKDFIFIAGQIYRNVKMRDTEFYLSEARYREDAGGLWFRGFWIGFDKTYNVLIERQEFPVHCPEDWEPIGYAS